VIDDPSVKVGGGGLYLVKKLPGLLILLKEDRSYLKEPGSNAELSPKTPVNGSVPSSYPIKRYG